MSALEDFDRAFKAGWAGLQLAKGGSVAVKAAHKAGKTARADHDYWEQKEDQA
jgi:hypothetical protein